MLLCDVAKQSEVLKFLIDRIVFTAIRDIAQLLVILVDLLVEFYDVLLVLIDISLEAGDNFLIGLDFTFQGSQLSLYGLHFLRESTTKSEDLIYLVIRLL